MPITPCSTPSQASNPHMPSRAEQPSPKKIPQPELLAQLPPPSVSSLAPSRVKKTDSRETTLKTLSTARKKLALSGDSSTLSSSSTTSGKRERIKTSHTRRVKRKLEKNNPNLPSQTPRKKGSLNLSSSASAMSYFQLQKEISRHTSLKELTLSDRGAHVDFYLITIIAKNNPELRALDLSNCPLVSDAYLEHIVTRCTKLRKLTLRGCTKITEKSLKLIAENCPELKHLDLHGCPQINSESVQQLSESNSQLETIRLPDSDDFTLTNFLFLASQHPELKEITSGQTTLSPSKRLRNSLKKKKGAASLILNNLRKEAAAEAARTLYPES